MRFNSFATRTISICLAASIFFASCSSTTLIQSTPPGAKVYLNGESVGTTPYSHTDTRIIGSVTTVKLEKEGYETLNTTFSRDEEVDIGAIIGGFFVLVPFLWTMKYKPAHSYELIPIGNSPKSSDEKTDRKTDPKSKADRLRELKKLLDDKIITQEEFDAEKKKILEEK